MLEKCMSNSFKSRVFKYYMGVCLQRPEPWKRVALKEFVEEVTKKAVIDNTENVKVVMNIRCS